MQVKYIQSLAWMFFSSPDGPHLHVGVFVDEMLLLSVMVRRHQPCPCGARKVESWGENATRYACELHAWDACPVVRVGFVNNERGADGHEVAGTAAVIVVMVSDLRQVWDEVHRSKAWLTSRCEMGLLRLSWTQRMTGMLCCGGGPTTMTRSVRSAIVCA